MREKIIGRGAEALLIKKGSVLLKRRIKKGYRHERLDFMLRAGRTRREARILERASRVINVPRVRAIDGMAKKRFEPETEIEMDFIKGKVLSENLDRLNMRKALKVCKIIGTEVACLHNAGIIHGDLTTSNMILHRGKVYLIDFGLGFHSARTEDKAVDLHLLREALKSRHFKKADNYFKEVLKGYDLFGNSRVVTERLKKVEARGRYKGKKMPLIH